MILKPPEFIRPIYGHSFGPGRGLVGCWLMNEGTGDRIFDLSDNGNPGNITGATWTSGKFGSVLGFDGTGDEITIVNSAELFNMPALTIIAGVKFEGTERVDQYDIVDAWNTDDTNYLLRFDNALGIKKIQFYIDTSSGSAGGNFDNTDLSDQLPHQIAAVYNGSSMRVYKDAVISPTSIAHSGPIDVGATYISIGGQIALSNDFWIGNIEYVYIFNRALSASEIALLYREPFCMFERDM